MNKMLNFVARWNPAHGVLICAPEIPVLAEGLGEARAEFVYVCVLGTAQPVIMPFEVFMKESSSIKGDKDRQQVAIQTAPLALTKLRKMNVLEPDELKYRILPEPLPIFALNRERLCRNV